MAISRQTRLSAIDSAIRAFRQGILPPRKDRDYVADILAQVRDDEARRPEQVDRERKQQRQRDLSQAIYEDTWRR